MFLREGGWELGVNDGGPKEPSVVQRREDPERRGEGAAFPV